MENPFPPSLPCRKQSGEWSDCVDCTVIGFQITGSVGSNLGPAGIGSIADAVMRHRGTSSLGTSPSGVN
jgi:hypothetical protein